MGKVRAVLQLGALDEKNGEEVEFDCEWKKNKSDSDEHLVGVTNSKSTHDGNYINPYRAWLIKSDQLPPAFVRVNAKLVKCQGGAVD
jgi:hypothetical protein